MDAKDRPPRARIIVPDNPPPPPICIECHKPITVLISAVSPRNPRRHMVAVPAAYIKTAAGPLCGDCWVAQQPDRELVTDVDRLFAPLLAPVRLPDMPDQPQRVYTRNGKVIWSEPLNPQPDNRRNGRLTITGGDA